MKRILALFLTLVLVLGGGISLRVSAAEKENPVPKAKQAVVCIAAGIYFQNGKVTTYDGYYSTGTGFGVGESGEFADTFVTNCHVVADDNMEPYDFVYICIDGADIAKESTLIKCKILYVDPQIDVAVIQADEPISGVTTLPLLPAESMETGDRVYALGFPGIADKVAAETLYTAEDITVTDGILSRYLVKKSGVKTIAHTAMVNHGNSGGPLINERGEVVGINTSIFYNANIQKREDGSLVAPEPDLRSYAIYIDYGIEALQELELPYVDASKVEPTEPTEATEAEPAEPKPGGGTIVTWIVAVAVIASAAVVILLVRRKKEVKNKGSVYQIRGLAGPVQGTAWILETELTVGRDPASAIALPMDTNGVSRNHCRIALYEGKVWVTDMNSAYGTFLCGRKLPANTPVELPADTELQIGSKNVVLCLKI